MRRTIFLLLLILLLAACQPISAAPTSTPFTPPPPTATDSVPTATTPPGAELFAGSIELEYDLYWKAGAYGDLMHFDHETQELSCLVGESSDCKFAIKGRLFDYRLNEDRSKILVYWQPLQDLQDTGKLALLDLEESSFNLFDEIERGAGLYDLKISPDGLWAAYKKVELEIIETEQGSQQGQVLSVIITATQDSTLQGFYKYDCSCGYSRLHWSPDNTSVAWGGFDNLWIAEREGGEWIETAYFEETPYSHHFPDAWSLSSEHLTYVQSETAPDGASFSTIEYVVNPENGTFVEVGRSIPGESLSYPYWLTEDKLASLLTVSENMYAIQNTLNIIELSQEQNGLTQETRKYELVFEEQGQPFLLTPLSNSLLTFGRITQMQSDNSYWIETYTFNEAGQELKLIASCPFSSQDRPFIKHADWTRNHDLLFSDHNGRALILSSNGPGCLDLNDLLGEKLVELNWAP